jgi:Tfp pilus assembly protein PilN
VLAVAGYVLTTNQITTRKGDIARAQQETQTAQSRSAGLAKYGEFEQVANARVSAVASLAQGRIDYERILRETAHVLPAGVWITQLDAEASGNGSTGASSSSTPVPLSPSVHFSGCAPSQKSVAATLVRLRALHGSDDVQLNDSGKALSLSGGSGGGSGDCGNHYAFDILVVLSPAVTGYGDAGSKVPATLGGGS